MNCFRKLNQKFITVHSKTRPYLWQKAREKALQPLRIRQYSRHKTLVNTKLLFLFISEEPQDGTRLHCNVVRLLFFQSLWVFFFPFFLLKNYGIREIVTFQNVIVGSFCVLLFYRLLNFCMHILIDYSNVINSNVSISLFTQEK